ncbi:DUF3159 domain-containing protein [Rhodococcoides fascians]|jgi:hypothetical protein|uniref:DUF3159 domain-containing protein n=1 Tax=Nocardiaceae TaxID=85025 RepID=UPI00041BBD2E|nr:MULTISPECIES: DUF3159 domain-containing protein [Rhodococcus]MBJ7322292.1 DUF3159 domain-containing protein [Rhodococcus sp. (in: high G+C Gram-positive bacteria)]MBJ7349291.1 DUF3159 domain-containing protein [Rhodococcus sp. (in: high G+C Gram-positive bacteria)]MBY4108830.1 DUF3159 domain-containing protein [Rhodococcus fascians]MBY4112641.1 DUF3159 domain-containing protein [Rhodococcus fascians]MBY4228848.1 DUF3159 domain-containing protein [Rhodococcus fascians]
MPEPVPDTSTPDAVKTAAPTVLEQLGGVSGLVYSTLPVVVFVPFNSYFGLSVALWAALGVAAAVLVWRLVRRSPIQPAISGFFGVGICAFIAYRTGDAKGYFLFGIYTSLVYGGAFVLSVLARWPLVGVIWGYLNGKGTSWRRERSAVRYYDVATIAWASVFAARYIVQSQLYDSDQTGWLAVARIGMGWPLTGVALLVTLWAVRQADRALDLASNDEQADELPSGQTDRST